MFLVVLLTCNTADVYLREESQLLYINNIKNLYLPVLSIIGSLATLLSIASLSCESPVPPHAIGVLLDQHLVTVEAV